jgi:hypothetical protein
VAQVVGTPRIDASRLQRGVPVAAGEVVHVKGTSARGRKDKKRVEPRRQGVERGGCARRKRNAPAAPLRLGFLDTPVGEAAAHMDHARLPIDVSLFQRGHGEIKAFLEASDQLGAEQFEVVSARLAYLEEAATRLGRVDWRNAFAGAMVSLVLNSVIPPDLFQAVWQLAAQGLSVVLGGPLAIEG